MLLLLFFTGEREHVQKKTFTKWVNSHLIQVNRKVTDLYTDLRDGKLLLSLLEILSGERLVRPSFVHTLFGLSIQYVHFFAVCLLHN